MTALTAEELIAWVETTTDGWRTLFESHPELLALACDIRESQTVEDLVHHIVAVELRYAQRLAGEVESPYAEVPRGSVASLFGTHARAIGLLRSVLSRPAYDWELTLEFVTRSAGTLRASRRTVLVHMLMHAIRHYAQLATLVRHAGTPAGWHMDYLFMGVQ
jgi:uncharacterized damage-inducible protein DinB